MALVLSHTELKRVNLALEKLRGNLALSIDKRSRLSLGKLGLPNGKRPNQAKLLEKNDEAEDKIVILETIQMKVKEEMRRIEGAEVAPLKRA